LDQGKVDGWEKEKCLQNFGNKSSKEETKDDDRKGLRRIGIEDVDWIELVQDMV
jgi:hypothetical protein